MSLKYDKTDGTDYYRKSYMDNKKTYDKFMGSMSFRKSWEYRMQRHSEMLKPYLTNADLPTFEDTPPDPIEPKPKPKIPGCMDPSALNYNPFATYSDGSCKYDGMIPGCTHPEALNYNPKAQIDDGSCMFSPCPIPPCWDPPTETYGCMDRNAINFNPSATRDNGSCKYKPDIPDPDQPTYVLNCWALDCYCPGMIQTIKYKCTRPCKSTFLKGKWSNLQSPVTQGLEAFAAVTQNQYATMMFGMAPTPGSTGALPPGWVVVPHCIPTEVYIKAPVGKDSFEILHFGTTFYRPGEIQYTEMFTGDPGEYKWEWYTEWTMQPCGNCCKSESILLTSDSQKSGTTQVINLENAQTTAVTYYWEATFGACSPAEGFHTTYAAPIDSWCLHDTITVYLGGKDGPQCDSTQIWIYAGSETELAYGVWGGPDAAHGGEVYCSGPGIVNPSYPCEYFCCWLGYNCLGVKILNGAYVFCTDSCDPGGVFRWCGWPDWESRFCTRNGEIHDYRTSTMIANGCCPYALL